MCKKLEYLERTTDHGQDNTSITSIDADLIEDTIDPD
jgi:hypothetical protein